MTLVTIAGRRYAHDLNPPFTEPLEDSVQLGLIDDVADHYGVAKNLQVFERPNQRSQLAAYDNPVADRSCTDETYVL
ncbi:MAG TPA: hypothetical protein VNT27_04835 [Propionibacteriaceae bacterium]|nr:hypothetical protein [Propionibacteriaceae bacterium]